MGVARFTINDNGRCIWAGHSNPLKMLLCVRQLLVIANGDFDREVEVYFGELKGTIKVVDALKAIASEYPNVLVCMEDGGYEEIAFWEIKEVKSF
tara:strand:+ start:8355 stop:8639 length:285 start_codon:yes stop_codon:yes gene_type:complete